MSYEYYFPVDGEYGFLDCNAWIIISDRIANVLLPLKPYCILVTDHLQRYVPEIFPEEFYESPHSSAVNFLRNIRNANIAIATSDETLKDLRSYSGARGILLKLPTAIDADYFCTLAARANSTPPTNPKHSFFIWVTNTTQHKNHLRTIKALDGFFAKHPSLSVVITGTNTDLFQLCENDEGPNGRELIYSNEYVRNVRNELSKLQLRHPSRIRVLGEVSDTTYLDLLSKARFLLHNVIADNGTYCVIEAALMGTPSISSCYPQMIEIDTEFELNLRFFDPYSICDLEEQLLKHESLVAPNQIRTLDLIKAKHFSNWGDTLMNAIRSLSHEHPMTIQAL
ncbi:glycosyltransferase [Pirellulaceae bacterium SH501]